MPVLIGCGCGCFGAVGFCLEPMKLHSYRFPVQWSPDVTHSVNNSDEFL